MVTLPTLEFKVACEDWEFEQIHALNYRTFVEEIPQHAKDPSRRLVDKFHRDNTYFVCIRDRQIVGMISVHDSRPFSLDAKLDNLDSYLPPHRSLCEVRLLAVDARYRGGRVLKGLLKLLVKHGIERGYDLAIMSGLESQQKLYRHIGWVPFGPLVGSDEARFQPMYLTLHVFATKTRAIVEEGPSARCSHPCVNLLPGPVQIAKEVRAAFVGTPRSHRSEELLDDLALIKRRLCRFVGAHSVEIFMGSGTLANDVIAGQLSLLSSPGMVLSNGEFGERLVRHARGAGLAFEVLEMPWGEPFEEAHIEQALDQCPDAAWLWAVHCETSTGILNDLTTLAGISRRRYIRLCMDCVSSVGVVPIDLNAVYLASGVSGKGVGAYPGLSMVYYDHQVDPAPDRLPRCLDLGQYAAQQGVPFTLSSNLLYAMEAALDACDAGTSMRCSTHLSEWLRSRLRQAGFVIVAPDEHVCPAIITLALPESQSSVVLGRNLEEQGYLLSFNSEYLLKRNWIQIALMSEVSQEQIEGLCDLMQLLCSDVQSRRQTG